MNIVGIDQIKKVLPAIDLLPAIEAGFVAYSEGRSVTPPVGELLFHKPPGDVHIKYGYLVGDRYYVIKVASSFYENPNIGLPSSNGLMMLFSQKTGELLSILLDEGYLTDLRTAVAGAIACKHLAPREVERIGIVGTGTQARLQLQHLAEVTSCRKAVVWGRSQQRLAKYREELEAEGFSIDATTEISDVTSACNLIVTATPSTSPILRADQIKSGTHITAVGADTTAKQELDPAILAKADVVVADSISQCTERGEIHRALKSGVIETEKIIELGHVISGKASGRVSDDQITVADLTGVAVQDIQISKAVYEALRE